jgi:hypothetical protein
MILRNLIRMWNLIMTLNNKKIEVNSIKQLSNDCFKFSHQLLDDNHLAYLDVEVIFLLQLIFEFLLDGVSRILSIPHE